MTSKRPSFATLAVRAGQKSDPVTGAHATPIFQTSTYQLQSVEYGARLTQDGPARDAYSRAGNPTVRAVEEKVAALENGEAAVAFGSGIGAIAPVFLSHLRPGDEVLTLGPIYSDTHTLLTTLLAEYGIASRRIEPAELDTAIAAADVNPNDDMNRPTITVIKPTGIKTARRASVVASTANPISRVPSIAAWKGFIPFSSTKR